MRKVLSLFLIAVLPVLATAHGHGVGAVRVGGHVGVHHDIFHHRHVNNTLFLNRVVDPGLYSGTLSRFSSAGCGSTYAPSATVLPQTDPGVCPQTSGSVLPSTDPGYNTLTTRTITTYQGVRGYFTADVIGRRFFVSGAHVIAIGHGHRFVGTLPRGVRVHGHIPRHGVVAVGHRPSLALRAPGVRLRVR